MRTEAQRQAARKYRQKMRAQNKFHEVKFGVTLQRKANAELIEILERVDSKSGAIKQALYEHWIVEGHLPPMKDEEGEEQEEERTEKGA